MNVFEQITIDSIQDLFTDDPEIKELLKKQVKLSKVLSELNTQYSKGIQKLTRIKEYLDVAPEKSEVEKTRSELNESFILAKRFVEKCEVSIADNTEQIESIYTQLADKQLQIIEKQREKFDTLSSKFMKRISEIQSNELKDLAICFAELSKCYSRDQFKCPNPNITQYFEEMLEYMISALQNIPVREIDVVVY